MDFAATTPNALIAGAALAVLVALWAWRKGWLSGSGAVAATLVGTAVFAGGVATTAALLFFFLSAALLDRRFRPITPDNSLTREQAEPRTAAQVLASGGVPALAGLAWVYSGNPLWIAAALAALAFSTADTWATHIGMTASRPPRLLGVGCAVPEGLSGGMTLRGTVGSVGGALGVSVFVMLTSRPVGFVPIVVIAGAGFAATLVDSLLGATLQTRRRCCECGEPTEKGSHCGQRSERLRGFLSNSAVNMVCSGMAGLLAWWFLA